MAYGCAPPGLPVPQTAPFIPAPRVRRSSLPGLPQARTLEYDFRGTQEVTFPPFTPAQAQAFEAWWRGDLRRGGSWFITSNWPTPLGWRKNVARRFTAVRWEHIAAGRWRVSASTEVMGALQVKPDDNYCGGGGGYACGESGPEFWLLARDPPYVNDWDSPNAGGDFVGTDPANWLPWNDAFGYTIGSLFSFQHLLVRRYNVERGPGGALISATPDTETTYETLPADQRVWTPSGGPDIPAAVAPTDPSTWAGDGSIWVVFANQFENGSGILRLGGGNQTWITVTAGFYADFAVEYACIA